MPSPAVSLPPPPTGGYLQWVTQKPEDVAAYLAFVYSMQNFEIAVTKNGVTTRYPVRLGGENAVVAINV